MPLGNLDYLLDVSSFLKEIALTVLEKEQAVEKGAEIQLKQIKEDMKPGGSIIVANEWEKMSLNGDAGYFTEAEIMDNSICSLVNNSEMSLLDPTIFDDDKSKFFGNTDSSLFARKRFSESKRVEKVDKGSQSPTLEIPRSDDLKSNNQGKKYVSEIRINVDSKSKSSSSTAPSKSQRQVDVLNPGSMYMNSRKSSGDERLDCSLERPISSCTPSWLLKPAERSEVNLAVGNNGGSACGIGNAGLGGGGQPQKSTSKTSTCACSEQTHISVHEMHKCIFICPTDAKTLDVGGKVKCSALMNGVKGAHGDSEKLALRSTSTQTFCHWPFSNLSVKESGVGPDDMTIHEADLTMVTEEPRTIQSILESETTKKIKTALKLEREKSTLSMKGKSKSPMKKCSAVSMRSKADSKVSEKTIRATKSTPLASNQPTSIKPSKIIRQTSPISQEATEADEATLEHDDDDDTVKDVAENDELDHDEDIDSIEDLEDEEVPIKPRPKNSKLNNKPSKKLRPQSKLQYRSLSRTSLSSVCSRSKADKISTRKTQHMGKQSQYSRQLPSGAGQVGKSAKTGKSQSKQKSSQQKHQTGNNVRLWSPPSNSWTGSASQEDHSMDQPMSEIQRLLESLNTQLQSGQTPSHQVHGGMERTSHHSHDESVSHHSHVIPPGGKRSRHSDGLGDAFWANPLNTKDTHLTKPNRSGSSSRKLTPSDKGGKGCVNPELEAVCKSMYKNNAKGGKSLSIKAPSRPPLRKEDQKSFNSVPKKLEEPKVERSSASGRNQSSTMRTPVGGRQENNAVTETINRFPQLKHVRAFDLTPYDEMVKSHLSANDRRLKSVAAKNSCKIEIDGPFRVFDPNASCMAMRSKVSYRCYVGSASKEKLEKCINYLKETFPNTSLRIKV